MRRRTGWRSPAALGNTLPERGLLLLMVWLFLEGSVLQLGAASSPDVTQQADLDNHNVSEKRHKEPKKLFPVLSLDYENVQTPFEITLWVLLASLMKLGEYWRGAVDQLMQWSQWQGDSPLQSASVRTKTRPSSLQNTWKSHVIQKASRC